MDLHQQRLLILIVAFNAEGTLCDVLDRIPRRVTSDFDCEVLVIDDASADATFERGLEYRQSRPDLPLTVLRNDVNQGYGGNQKVGYEYAIQEGFDLVALLHGDGQYAPEKLPDLVAPLAQDQADAVFGSRMLTPGAARRGGMPLYKFVGNRILTTTQNRLVNARLSEWHSGYRAYRVDSLASIRFAVNRNDFAFDTEIILQLHLNGFRIHEVPIPTYYGDEICHVDGIKYARQVTVASAMAALHRTGLIRKRSLTTTSAEVSNSHYAVKLDQPSSHTEVLRRIAPGSRVIDLGAGPGAFAVALADTGVEVTAADLYPPTTIDPRVRSRLIDLNRPAIDLESYDTVLALDVIEHLDDPEAFLDWLRLALGSRPRRVIVTTPNVAFVIQRLLLLLGRFEYAERGILDRTHRRLFTRGSIRRALAEAGFEVQDVTGIPAPFSQVLGTGWSARALTTVNAWLIKVSPRLFSYQVLVEAVSTPHPRHVLVEARASADNAA